MVVVSGRELRAVKGMATEQVRDDSGGLREVGAVADFAAGELRLAGKTDEARLENAFEAGRAEGWREATEAAPVPAIEPNVTRVTLFGRVAWGPPPGLSSGLAARLRGL